MTPLQYAILVGAGALATTFAQLRVLGNYPVLYLLKDHLHMKQEEVAVFFLWTSFAWNVKPLAGILTDAFPIFGTRRRHYMMLGAAFAGVFWVLMGASANMYSLLFAFGIALNIAMVFASTVMGGLMVEAGHAFGAPGRISSLRQIVQSSSGIVAPLLGAWLAGKVFGLTAGIGAGSLIALAILTYYLLHERAPAASLSPADTSTVLAGNQYRLSPGIIIGGFVVCAAAAWFISMPNVRNVGISLFALLGVFVLIMILIFLPIANAVIVRAQGQLVQIFKSRTLWMAAAMLLLVYTVPGLNTALFYRQNDALKFTAKFIAGMDSLAAICGVIGAIVYGLICKRFNLRVLLVSSIAMTAATTLFFLDMIYARPTAPYVHIFTGFAGILSELALMDLAVRSTPRGCEALGFALMMSVRNFGIAISDVLGTKLIDVYQFKFNWLVLINAGTTAIILLFIPLLPRLIMSRREGEKAD
jgi:hypothetical protein